MRYSALLCHLGASSVALAGVAATGEHPSPERRVLQDVQLTELNRLLSRIELNIGALGRIEVPVTHIMGHESDADLDISNLKCHGLSLGGLSIVATKVSQQQIDLTISATQISIACGCDWRYHYAIGGEGTATAQADAGMGNSATVTVSFRSDDFRTSLPSMPPAQSTCTMRHDGSTGSGDGLAVTLNELHGDDAGGHIGAVTVDHVVHEQAEEGIRSALSNGAFCAQIGQAVPCTCR